MRWWQAHAKGTMAGWVCLSAADGPFPTTHMMLLYAPELHFSHLGGITQLEQICSLRHSDFFMSFLIKRNRMVWEIVGAISGNVLVFVIAADLTPNLASSSLYFNTNTQKMSGANMSIAWIEISH